MGMMVFMPLMRHLLTVITMSLLAFRFGFTMMIMIRVRFTGSRSQYVHAF